MQKADLEAIHAAERRRGEALVAGDFDALLSLLSPTLSHTHMPGNTQDLEAYMRFTREDIVFLDIGRSDLDVRLFGSTAIMTGRMDSVIRIVASQQVVTPRSQVLQVWRRQDGGWLLEAFQATAIAS